MHCNVQLVCDVHQAWLVCVLLQMHLSLHQTPSLVSHTHLLHGTARCMVQHAARYSTLYGIAHCMAQQQKAQC